jgi:hypothetical protein
MRRAGAPQCEQNFAPRNIIPKQEGHATVASREPQWLHFEESLEAEAPHIGHLRVSAGMIRKEIFNAKTPGGKDAILI